MPVNQILLKSYGAADADTGCHKDNLQVWFDPRKFSSVADGATCTSHSASALPDTTWHVTSGGGTLSYVSGTNDQAIENSSSTDTLGFYTKNQDVTVFDNIDNYSFEFWVYVGAQDIENWGFIGGKSGFWGANDGGVYINSDGENWGFHSSTAGSYLDMPANGWHHVVYVRNLADGNCRKLYVDNSLVLQDNTGDGVAQHTLNNNCALTVGCSSSADGSGTSYSPKNNFKYGHARFYSDSLTASEVQTNWNAEKAIYGL